MRSGVLLRSDGSWGESLGIRDTWRKVLMKSICLKTLFFLGNALVGIVAAPVLAQEKAPETKLEFVSVPAGSLEMGSPKDSFPTLEFPPTRVEVSAFEIGRMEAAYAH